MLTKGKKLGAALLLSASTIFSGCAAKAEGAENQASNSSIPQCAPLFQTEAGRVLNASTSAYKYSKDNPGAVGISIFPGGDLPGNTAHEYGTNIAQAFRDRGVEAECFVHHERHATGSGVDYKVAGLSWKEKGSFSIGEAIEKDVLRGVLAEAKTAKMLLTSRDEPIPQEDYTLAQN